MKSSMSVKFLWRLYNMVVPHFQESMIGEKRFSADFQMLCESGGGVSPPLRLDSFLRD